MVPVVVHLMHRLENMKMYLSTANGVTMEPQVKLRSVRCVATGKVTTQSTNKTKRLLKTGQYVEVTPEGTEAPNRLTHPVYNNKGQANALKREGRPLLWLAGICFVLAGLGSLYAFVLR